MFPGLRCYGLVQGVSGQFLYQAAVNRLGANWSKGLGGISPNPFFVGECSRATARATPASRHCSP